MLACNLPDTNRYGTVGRLLPGIEARLEPVPGLSEGKRLFVRGPNVMAGYLLADKPGVVVAPAERLARHRRHRHHRRRLRQHPRARQALRQARRRDGLAGRRRDARLRPVERRPARRPQLSRPAQGRAAAARHRQAGGRARTISSPTPAARASRSCGCRSRSWSSPPCRCSPPARSTCRRPSRWRAQARPACNCAPASQCAKSARAQAGVAPPQRRRREREVPLRQALTAGRALTWMVAIRRFASRAARGTPRLSTP